MNGARRRQHRSVFSHRVRSICRGWDEASGSFLQGGGLGTACRLLQERAQGCGLPARTERACAKGFGQERKQLRAAEKRRAV